MLLLEYRPTFRSEYLQGYVQNHAPTLEQVLENRCQTRYMLATTTQRTVSPTERLTRARRNKRVSSGFNLQTTIIDREKLLSETRFDSWQENRIPEATQRTYLERCRIFDVIHYEAVPDLFFCRRVGPSIRRCRRHARLGRGKQSSLPFG